MSHERATSNIPLFLSHHVLLLSPLFFFLCSFIHFLTLTHPRSIAVPIPVLLPSLLFPLSSDLLSPILTVYKPSGWLVNHSGLRHFVGCVWGHVTASLSNQRAIMLSICGTYVRLTRCISPSINPFPPTLNKNINATCNNLSHGWAWQGIGLPTS